MKPTEVDGVFEGSMPSENEEGAERKYQIGGHEIFFFNLKRMIN